MSLAERDKYRQCRVVCTAGESRFPAIEPSGVAVSRTPVPSFQSAFRSPWVDFESVTGNGIARTPSCYNARKREKVTAPFETFPVVRFIITGKRKRSNFSPLLGAGGREGSGGEKGNGRKAVGRGEVRSSLAREIKPTISASLFSLPAHGRVLFPRFRSEKSSFGPLEKPSVLSVSLKFHSSPWRGDLRGKLPADGNLFTCSLDTAARFHLNVGPPRSEALAAPTNLAA